VGYDGELEALGAFGGEPVLEEVGEHPDTERDEHIGKEGPFRGPDFASFGEGADRVGVLGFVDGSFESAEPVGDEVKGQDAHDHENEGLEGVGPSRGTRATCKDIGEDDRTDHKAGKPRWDGSVVSPFGEDAGSNDISVGFQLGSSDSCDCLTGSDDSNEKVGNDEEDEDGEEEVSEGLGLKAGTEILDLRDVAVAFPDRPEFNANEKKTSSVNESGRRRHKAVGADAPLKGLAG